MARDDIATRSKALRRRGATGRPAKIPPKPSTKLARSARVALVTATLPNRDALTLRFDGPTLLLTLESSFVEVTSRGASYALGRTACVVLPSGARATLRATTPTARIAALTFGESLIDAVVRVNRKLKLDRTRLMQSLAAPMLLPRTAWVHEIGHRYVFEREALEAHDNRATRFLEEEILKEIYYLFRDRDQGADRAPLAGRYSPTIEHALAYVDAHLFEPMAVAALAEHAGASESTLLRAFKRELGCTPAAYWRTRRLDEAMLLLTSGREAVAEVASRVGYENSTAFAHAFGLRFGQPPSAFRPRRPVRRAP